MVADIGGPDCVPSEGDNINMVDVLTELTMPEALIFGSGENPFAKREEETRGGGGFRQQGYTQQFQLQDVNALTKSSAPIGSPQKQFGDVQENGFGDEENSIKKVSDINNLDAKRSDKKSIDATQHQVIRSVSQYI